MRSPDPFGIGASSTVDIGVPSSACGEGSGKFVLSLHPPLAVAAKLQRVNGLVRANTWRVRLHSLGPHAGARHRNGVEPAHARPGARLANTDSGNDIQGRRPTVTPDPALHVLS